MNNVTEGNTDFTLPGQCNVQKGQSPFPRWHQNIPSSSSSSSTNFIAMQVLNKTSRPLCVTYYTTAVMSMLLANSLHCRMICGTVPSSVCAYCMEKLPTPSNPNHTKANNSINRRWTWTLRRSSGIVSVTMYASPPSQPSTWRKQLVVWPMPLGRILLRSIALITVLLPFDVLHTNISSFCHTETANIHYW